MKKIILILAIAFIGCNSNNKKITLTHEDFMILYKNGSLKGKVSGLTYEWDEGWIRDSIEIQNTIFK